MYSRMDMQWEFHKQRENKGGSDGKIADKQGRMREVKKRGEDKKKRARTA